MKNYAIGFALIASLIALGVPAGTAQQAARTDVSASVGLEEGFAHPPQSARPRVWWHWMNGNISEEGIKLDLEWMHRVGLAGYQSFDAALATPQVVDKRLAYMTPEWKHAFKYATTLASQLGMEQAIAGSPGWSESGGPWVPPSHGMKKYVWSETLVEGGRPFTGKLVAPPSTTGAFQNMGIHDELGAPEGAKQAPSFYADSVVVAYRQTAADVSIESLHPVMAASSGSPDFALLSDGDLEHTAKLPIPAQGESAWIQYAFDTPQTIHAITFVTKEPGFIAAMIAGIGSPEKALEASDDGSSFRVIAQLSGGSAPEHTISFPAVTARYFRVTFKRTPPPPLPPWAEGLDPSSFGFKVGPAPTDYEISELVLHPGARVNRFEEKAAFTPEPDLYGYATPPVPASDAIAKSDVVDLTAKMHPDGTLDWTPPLGNWVVLRFGYSLLGITNHPATAEATGLEVDKLDRSDVKDYFEKYLDSYKETVGPDLIGAHGIHYVVNDSWEAGSQNWTDNMIAQFRKLRGYDPLPWMPVLAGRVVESADASDRFLWDFRKTISDLIANEHYGQLEETLHAWHMGHYGESHESGRAFVADGMEVKKFNEVPMSAMWTQVPGVNREQFGYNADDRESASVAHIYGQNIAAAESLTAAAGPWAWSPATLKPTADQELLNGINRIVIHESAHQPLVGKAPGLSLGPFGQWFNRNETWAEQAGPWIDYLARCSFLLQQGHFGADIVYFYGEDSNLTAIFANKSPDIPAGYGFDYINGDGLIHELSVVDGKIKTPSGMSYRVLALDSYSKHMSLPVLKAIHKLVAEGAIVSGEKPSDDPSLADDQAEFAKLNNELFGDGTGVHTVGKGRVYASSSLGETLTALNIEKDFDYTKPEADSHLEFVHRKLADGDLYFVDNRNPHAEQLDATFRVNGKAPELWHPDSGRIEPASFTTKDDCTTVSLNLEPWGTVFVVFRKSTMEKSRALPVITETKLETLEGPWQVAFPPDRGAPPSITLEKLASWNTNSDPGVKYFSGTGTYTKTVEAPADWFAKGSHIWIDLGEVRNLASVAVNGKSLGIVWHLPYRVDATSALKPGSNTLTIKVTDSWVNRLIGDQQADAKAQYTFTAVKPYKANSPLQEAGLLGPVTVLRTQSTSAAR